jgi:hypothetical protein
VTPGVRTSQRRPRRFFLRPVTSEACGEVANESGERKIRDSQWLVWAKRLQAIVELFFLTS